MPGLARCLWKILVVIAGPHCSGSLWKHALFFSASLRSLRLMAVATRSGRPFGLGPNRTAGNLLHHRMPLVTPFSEILQQSSETEERKNVNAKRWVHARIWTSNCKNCVTSDAVMPHGMHHKLIDSWPAHIISMQSMHPWQTQRQHTEIGPGQGHRGQRGSRIPMSKTPHES